jgi:hypothetical protein
MPQEADAPWPGGDGSDRSPFHPTRQEDGGLQKYWELDVGEMDTAAAAAARAAPRVGAALHTLAWTRDCSAGSHRAG